jgi:hypothetical protein
MYSSDAKVQRMMSDIKSLTEQGKSDEEIRQLLGIEIRQYQRYQKRIIELEKSEWAKLVSDKLESELLRLKTSFEHTYRTAKKLSEKEDYDDRLDALNTKDNARTNIIILLRQGPDYIKGRTPLPVDIPTEDIDDIEEEDIEEPEPENKALKKSREYIQKQLRKK